MYSYDRITPSHVFLPQYSAKILSCFVKTNGLFFSQLKQTILGMFISKTAWLTFWVHIEQIRLNPNLRISENKGHS